MTWILFDAETLELDPYYWFGGGPRAPLGDLGSRIARQNAPEPDWAEGRDACPGAIRR